MRLTYDPEADSILWTLDQADVQAETWAEPAEAVVIDFDGDKNPISIDIQRASQRYAVEALTAISLERRYRWPNWLLTMAWRWCTCASSRSSGGCGR